MPSVRPKVVCLLRNLGRILLIRDIDPHDGLKFLVPIGGGLEFGETLEQAVRREVFEEIGVQLPNAKRIAMIENMFTFAGRAEHELVFVYESECNEPALCAREDVVVTESNGRSLSARWYSLADIVHTGLPLFPRGLWDLLNAESAPCHESGA